MIRDDPEALAAFREAMKHQGQRTDISDNITEVVSPSATGTSRAYSISRVQRECDADTVAGSGSSPGRRRKPARPEENEVLSLSLR